MSTAKIVDDPATGEYTVQSVERGWHLTLAALREANIAGQQYFRKPGFTPWTLNDWLTALAGEVGEAANLLKKVRREDFTLDEARAAIADELGDTLIYLDHLARAAGIDLEVAVTEKWNKVHERRGSPLRIVAGRLAPIPTDSASATSSEIP